MLRHMYMLQNSCGEIYCLEPRRLEDYRDTLPGSLSFSSTLFFWLFHEVIFAPFISRTPLSTLKKTNLFSLLSSLNQVTSEGFNASITPVCSFKLVFKCHTFGETSSNTSAPILSRTSFSVILLPLPKTSIVSVIGLRHMVTISGSLLIW